MRTRLGVCIFACCFGFQAVAEEEQGWSGEGRVGFVATGGNTDTETLNVGIDVQRKSDKWLHSLGLRAVNASDTGQTTAERYEFAGKTQHELSPKSYWYTTLRYQDDRFSAFEYQSSLAGGYGRKFIDNDVTLLSGEAGAGFRRSKPLDMEAEGDAIFQGSIKYQRKISDTAKVLNTFIVEAGEENTYLQNVAAVELKVNNRISMSAGYELRHNTDVGPGIERTDTLTTLNLIFGF